MYNLAGIRGSSANRSTQSDSGKGIKRKPEKETETDTKQIAIDNFKNNGINRDEVRQKKKLKELESVLDLQDIKTVSNVSRHILQSQSGAEEETEFTTNNQMPGLTISQIGQLEDESSIPKGHFRLTVGSISRIFSDEVRQVLAAKSKYFCEVFNNFSEAPNKSISLRQSLLTNEPDITFKLINYIINSNSTDQDDFSEPLDVNDSLSDGIEFLCKVLSIANYFQYDLLKVELKSQLMEKISTINSDYDLSLKAFKLCVETTPNSDEDWEELYGFAIGHPLLKTLVEFPSYLLSENALFLINFLEKYKDKNPCDKILITVDFNNISKSIRLIEKLCSWTPNSVAAIIWVKNFEFKTTTCDGVAEEPIKDSTLNKENSEALLRNYSYAAVCAMEKICESSPLVTTIKFLPDFLLDPHYIIDWASVPATSRLIAVEFYFKATPFALYIRYDGSWIQPPITG
jgi:hypothetical protein